MRKEYVGHAGDGISESPTKPNDLRVLRLEKFMYQTFAEQRNSLIVLDHCEEVCIQ